MSFAVVNTRGQVHGLARQRTFQAASLVKAVVLIGYVHRVERRGSP